MYKDLNCTACQTTFKQRCQVAYHEAMPIVLGGVVVLLVAVIAGLQ